MGRHIPQTPTASSAAALGGIAGVPSYPGQLPVYGRGQAVILYASNANWRVPTTGRFRVRVLGGSGLTDASGGTTSFGSLISATGGSKPNGTAGGLGGLGFGGDYQAAGGVGGTGLASIGGGGGGAAGSQLGPGGNGGNAVEVIDGSTTGRHGGGGGGVGGHNGGTGTTWGTPAGGGSPLASAVGGVSGYNFLGVTDYSAGAVTVDGLAPPYFYFLGGFGSGTADPGLSGQGGRGELSYMGSINGATIVGRQGGFGGGGGGGFGGAGYKSLLGGGQGGKTGFGGAGGGGYAHGEFNLTEGDQIPITVASSGLVIVEW